MVARRRRDPAGRLGRRYRRGVAQPRRRGGLRGRGRRGVRRESDVRGRAHALGAGRPAPGPAMSIRVVVADDQPLVRAGLAALLGCQPGIEVVDDTDGGGAVKAAVTHAPDVVLLDLATPASVDVLAQIVAERPVRVLAMTADYHPHRAWAALTAGAAGF